jgi:hypothetical protein
MTGRGEVAGARRAIWEGRRLPLGDGVGDQARDLPSSPKVTKTDKIVTRAPYRCAGGVRAETWVSWGILLSWVPTSEDRANTGVQNSPWTRLVLVRPEGMRGGGARTGRRPR